MYHVVHDVERMVNYKPPGGALSVDRLDGVCKVYMVSCKNEVMEILVWRFPPMQTSA